MAHTEAHLQEPAIHKAAGVAEAEVDSLDNDDRSSSLSEPEDDQDEVMPEYGTVNGMDELEPAVAHSSLDVDSEAETERLEQTPQKLRKHADSIRKTPSKLSYAATVEDDLSEPPSPLPTGAEAASSTSTIVTGVGKKRKRSDTAESSLTSADSDDIGESPRKRNHESPDELDPDQNEDIAETNGTADAQVEHLLESALLEEASRSPVVKTTKGKRGKQKGRKFAKETVADVEPQVEELDQPEEEQPEEGAAKKEEEQQYRAEASSLFEAVAKQFTSFRESLNNERLAITNAELQLLSESDCQHSEYKQQVACVDARRTKQIREANAYYSYRLKCIRERTLGERAQLHSQYFQEVRRLRDKFLYELGEDWYNIQKERRQQHQEEDDKYIFEFPTKRSAQIRQQAQYNQEISVLSGIGMYVGFPAAPDIKGAEGASLEDDLKSMKVSKRSSQPAAHRQQQPPFYSRRRSVSAHNERLAHDQFIEKNAWAQPQRPIHTHGMPNLTHTPDWAEPTPHSSTRNFIRNLGGHRPRTNSPFMTPLPQKRPQQNERSSSGTVMLASDGVEMPSSVAAAPPTSERMQHVHGGSSTQTSPLVVNKYRQNGTELTGFRNISNVSGISGASTIDAPLDSAEKRREEQPVPSSEIPTPQPGVFGMSQFHLHSNEHRGERSATVGFRAREGAYGTPAPLSTGGARPTSN